MFKVCEFKEEFYRLEARSSVDEIKKRGNNRFTNNNKKNDYFRDAADLKKIYAYKYVHKNKGFGK